MSAPLTGAGTILGTPRDVRQAVRQIGRQSVRQMAGLAKWRHFPQWREDGKELFFKDLTGVPVSVAVSASGTAFESGAPERLPIEGAIWPSWGVTGDGQRVLLALSPQANLEAPITVS